ncbi:DUF4907 domain-containing protein [Flavobacterium sp. ZT3R18]|uniref:DUF4907 domain-containing protein n=1 Tax=Flavobacterium sp. ZT3R18 TaxID=2594429 RepID=UPI001179DAEE|nr:DUF4907 domain-containing protein [Flavobacterium sp. ZT3R18]TRX38652.1 DUF4907 domain-containing protein [Flavobacterium sp. ZT3R18]
MTMTTSTENKSFWKQFQKDLSCFLNLCILTFLLGLLLSICCERKENLKLQSIKVNNSWGYTISNNKKIIIKQTVIPAISEYKSFKSEKEALAIGQLVLKKMESNLSPTITKNDLILLKIRI